METNKMAPSYLSDLVPELGQANVRVKDPEFVAKSIKSMMKDSHHKLQVVADFDRTISKYSQNGKICSTTHGVVEQSEFMPEKFKQEANKLKEEYLPIEFDPSRSVEEKIPKMIEWWTRGHALLLESGLTQGKLQDVVAKSSAKLRDGCIWLFDKLNEMGIPLLLFSAGLGDVIKETICQQSTYYDNMKLVSNFFHFDESGNMLGFTGNDVIHTFNKNEASIRHSNYFDKVKDRHNILLLGDSIGDVHMAMGAENTENLLKIGFLNFKIEESLLLYLDNFDVIIIEDETMDVVNGILRVITGLSKPPSSPSSGS